MELILTGQAIDAARALELGLINRVVPKGTCADAAVALAELVNQGSPLAVRYSRAVARASFSLAEDEVRRSAGDLRKTLLASADFREGPRAFAEKRRPDWQGR
jgi:enoyl-CoA hydratase